MLPESIVCTVISLVFNKCSCFQFAYNVLSWVLIVILFMDDLLYCFVILEVWGYALGECSLLVIISQSVRIYFGYYLSVWILSI